MSESALLAALGGVACLLMAAIGVMGLSDPGSRRQVLAYVLAWLVPGLGHVSLGRWKKGLFFFVILAATYAVGLWVSGWRTVTFDDQPFYYVGQFGSGVTLLLGQMLNASKAFPRVDLPTSWYDPGLLYVCAAGLLNIVIMLSVFEARPKEAPGQEGGAP